MQTCTKCHAEKPFEQFNHVKNNQTGYGTICKECLNKKNKTYRDQNPDYFKKKKEQYAQQGKEFVNNLKNKPCIDCGKTFPPECMEYDHLLNKVEIIGYAYRKWSKTHLLEEIAKCELVCVLCHRNRTYLRKQEVAKGWQNTQSYKMYQRGMFYIWMAKSKPCKICGVQYLPWQMELHHLPGTKERLIGRLIRYSLDRLQEEIDKCEVLCAACHRMKTVGLI